MHPLAALVRTWLVPQRGGCPARSSGRAALVLALVCALALVPAASAGTGEGSAPGSPDDRLEAWVSLPLRMHGGGEVHASAATLLAASLHGQIDLVLTAERLELVEVEHWEDARGSTAGATGTASGIRMREHTMDSPELRLTERHGGFTLLAWLEGQQAATGRAGASPSPAGPATDPPAPAPALDPVPPTGSATQTDTRTSTTGPTTSPSHISTLHGARWSDEDALDERTSSARTYRVGAPQEVRAVPADDDVDPYGTLFGRPVPFVHTIPSGWYEMQTLGAAHALAGGIGGYLAGADVDIDGADGDVLRLQLGERIEERPGSVYVPEQGWTGPGTHEERIVSYLQWRAVDASLTLHHTDSAVHAYGHDLSFRLDGGVSVPHATGTLATAEGLEHRIDASAVTVMGPEVAGRVAPAAGDGERTHLTAQGDVGLATIAGTTTLDRSFAPAAAAVGALALIGGALALAWKNAGGLLVPLFSRVTRKKALDHGTRNEIYTLVLENPGIATHEVVERLNVGWSTITYHLDVLERTELVVAHRSGRYKRYFDRTSGHYSNGRKQLVSLLQNDTTAAVADAVRREPGIVQRRIAERLGIAPSSVNWHVRRLFDAGLVEKRRVHRAIALHPGPAWDRVRPAPEPRSAADAAVAPPA